MEIGAEFSPEQYLSQPDFLNNEQAYYIENVTRSILTSSICVEELADEVIDSFPMAEYALPNIRMERVEQ